MGLLRDDDGSVFGLVNGWTDYNGGGKAVNLTIFVKPVELDRLRQFLKRKHKQAKMTQEDVGTFLLVCLGAGMDCWAADHGFQQGTTERLDNLRPYLKTKGSKRCTTKNRK